MIRLIAPQFFTTDVLATLAYYKDKLGFDCLGTWEDPPVYAVVGRDHRRIHFRFAKTPPHNPDKYADELLDAYLFVEDVDKLYAEFAARGVEFTRGLGNTPRYTREFVLKDCDGRLLAFGNYSTESDPLDKALMALGPGFTKEVRKRLAPVRDRFFQPPARSDSEHVQRLDRIERKDGLITTLERDGSTFLHVCVLLHDPVTAMEAVSWLLAHGANSNKVRDDGESPLSLAMKVGRTELVELIRRNSR
jgi:hypothetical protein